MSLVSRRIALVAPPDADSSHSPDVHSPNAAKANKRAASTECTPPPIVKRQLCVSAAAKPAPAPTVATFCAAGCLRHPGHGGLCLTADGPAPPSIKAVWKQAKVWDPEESEDEGDEGDA